LIAQVDVSNPAEAARKVLLAAYPELGGRNALVDIAVGPYSLDAQWPSTSRLSLRVYENGSANRTAPSTLIDAEVTFDENQRLVDMRSVGVFVNSDRLSRIKADVDRHKEWSENQILNALHTAGSHFAPDQMSDESAIFRQRLRLLEPVIGRVELDDVRFESRMSEYFKEGLPSARLEWRITIRILDGVGSTEYEIRCEPFEGRITSIHGYTP
jgi:hypothetical protein